MEQHHSFREEKDFDDNAHTFDYDFMDLDHKQQSEYHREKHHEKEFDERQHPHEAESDDEEQRWYSKYEGEWHAPLEEHHDHTVREQERPQEYTFEWHTTLPHEEEELYRYEPHHDIEEHHYMDRSHYEETPRQYEETQYETKKKSSKKDKSSTKPSSKSSKKSKSKKNDEHELYHGDDEYPVYPYEASIFYDVANGYDIYYDPHYNSPFDQYELDQLMTDREEEYFNQAALKATSSKKEKKSSKKQEDQEHYGVPFRREADRSPYAPRSTRHNSVIDNETPMYVRPYLEDPIFLQPDDGEVSLLHPDVTHPKVMDHEQHHDIQGDPDLENPDSDNEDEEPAWITDHRNTLKRTANLTSTVAANPNGFRHTGEKCNHNFECISGKCLSWLNKSPVCMPF